MEDFCKPLILIILSTREIAKTSYLPGAEDTMINKVVPSGRGLSIALRDWADPCDYPKLGWLERIIFDSGDERSRRPCA
jgi:hypothetical protein